MSLVKLECPICEFVFEADRHVAAQTRCTCCGHLFAPKKSSKHTSQSSVPKSQASLSPTLSQEDSLRVKVNSQGMVSRSDQIRSSIMLKRVRARRRSNLILLLLLVGTLVAGALVAKRFRELDAQTEQQVADMKLNTAFADQSSITPVPNIEVETDPSDLPPQAPTEKDMTKPAAAPTSTPLLDPPEFLYLSSSVAVGQAAHVKPYMMLLEIDSPQGTTYATGTIIDSRGYLLTSLSAVTGATKIQVSSARSRSQFKNQTSPPLSDTVMSVVAVSKSQQWAILEINRRFVLNAADIPIPETDRIVSRQPLLRIVAPRTPNDYPVSEMRVDARRKPSALTEKQKELLHISDNSNNSDISKSTEEVNWILSPHSDYDRLGAALISPDGELMAMLVAFDQEFSYYISLGGIRKVLTENDLTENDLTKKPLSSLK